MPSNKNKGYCPDCKYPIFKGDDVCRKCAEILAKEAKAAALERDKQLDIAIALGGKRAYNEYKLETFEVNDGNRKAYEYALAFDPDINMYLYGPTGSGKSHLSIGAVRKHLNISLPIVKTPLQIFREVRAATNRSANVEGAAIHHYTHAKLLVIDDLGIGSEKEFRADTLYEIIHGRYMDDLGGLIMTSNLSPDELTEKFKDDRIASRIFQMCRGRNGVVELTCGDYRVTGGK